MSRLRNLVVMRHAKAEQMAPSDVERPLAPRGLHDAEAAGSWLADQVPVPDHVLVSAAVRTRETWEQVRRGAGATWSALEASYDQGLYAAGVDTALDLLRLLDDDARTALVIGHNPTMAYLAQLLDDGGGDVTADGHLTQGFPTSAIAVFTYADSWADLAPATARLTAHHVARA